MKQLFSTALVLLSFLTFIGNPRAATPGNATEVVPDVPVKNTVTLVDLGAKTCVPCKMMAPILAELKKEYAGRAEVIFIDVWDKANDGKAKALKVMAIPTQIFYDRQGREVFRHVGFLDKKSMAAQLDKLLGQ